MGFQQDVGTEHICEWDHATMGGFEGLEHICEWDHATMGGFEGFSCQWVCKVD